VTLWEKVVKVISEVASQYNEQWQVRKQVINSMLIILLIFRLVCSKNSQSYGTTIDELWDSCDRLDLSLPQNDSIAPFSFCAARIKLDEATFKVLITMNRIFANQVDADLNQSNNSVINTTKHENFSLKVQMRTIKTNFKNCIHVFSRSIEELLLLQTKMTTAVKRAYHFIIGRNQKERPGRSYARKSMKPESKWHPSKEKKKKKKISEAPPMTVPL